MRIDVVLLPEEISGYMERIDERKVMKVKHAKLSDEKCMDGMKSGKREVDISEEVSRERLTDPVEGRMITNR